MLLCASVNPDAQQVRPSRGDRGVDVYVPIGRGPMIDVYQVKHFPGGLKEQASFPLRWYGKNKLDAHAAAHPEIIDYYLQSGRERLAQRLADVDRCSNSRGPQLRTRRARYSPAS